MAVRYQIILDSPLGHRPGMLTLWGENGPVAGTLSLLGFDNPVEGTREGPLLRLHHPLRTRVSRLDCETTLRTAEGTLEGTAQVGTTCMPVRGTALPDNMEERMEHIHEPE